MLIFPPHLTLFRKFWMGLRNPLPLFQTASIHHPRFTGKLFFLFFSQHFAIRIFLHSAPRTLSFFFICKNNRLRPPPPPQLLSQCNPCGGFSCVNPPRCPHPCICFTQSHLITPKSQSPNVIISMLPSNALVSPPAARNLKPNEWLGFRILLI